MTGRSCNACPYLTKVNISCRYIVFELKAKKTYKVTQCNSGVRSNNEKIMLDCKGGKKDNGGDWREMTKESKTRKCEKRRTF